MSERISVERRTRIQLGACVHYVTRDDAKTLYNALHAEFSDFDEVRELSQLARESVARELKLAELEAEVLALRNHVLESQEKVNEEDGA